MRKPMGTRSQLKRAPRPLTPVRLPEGSMKYLWIEDGVWHGVLRLRSHRQFRTEAKSEHACTTGLNKLYKEWLARDGVSG